MPQLDFLIITAQSMFLIIFFFGYFSFLKDILPILSFELKMKELLELSYLKWIDSNYQKVVQTDFGVLKMYKALNGLFNFFDTLTQKKPILFGFLYGYNLLSIRTLYRSKNEERVF